MKKNRVGEKSISNEGYDMEIIEYFGWDNSNILFEDGTVKKGVHYSHFKSGCVKKPVERIGEIFTTNQGYKIEIINYRSNIDCDIKFEDSLILKNRHYRNLISGSISHPFHKNVLNIGYKGIGCYDSTDKKHYQKWMSMLKRCYSKNNNEKSKSYKTIEVCEEWHNFQNFAQWFEENYIEGWELDKDLLSFDSKIYSPTSCCFLPNEINIFLKRSGNNHSSNKGVYPIRNGYKAIIQKYGKQIYLGFHNSLEKARKAYLNEKNKHKMELLEKYKDKLPDRTYNAILKFNVDTI